MLYKSLDEAKELLGNIFHVWPRPTSGVVQGQYTVLSDQKYNDRTSNYKNSLH